MNRAVLLSRSSLPGAVWEALAPYAELTKPRLVSMVLLSTAVGFCLADRSYGPLLFGFTLTATFLVAASAMVLNQFLECETDRQMVRTQNRPLPSGRLEPQNALLFGAGLSAAGFFIFIFMVNWISAFLALLTWAGYLFVYTPLKKRTSLATLIGAVPGALPPAIGWAAREGHLQFETLILFLIVFFWQIPHFLAIAWMHRDDYKRAGLALLSTMDEEGKFMARQMVVNVSALVPVSLLPTVFGLTGEIYFFGAFLLGIGFAGVIMFRAPHLDPRARYVLRASVIYLAALLVLMVLNQG